MFLQIKTFYCRKGLNSNGMIVVKENITSSGEVEMDKEDSSVTRPLNLLKSLFEKAGLECYRQLKQTNFPKELYNVYMFALKPKTVLCESSLEIHNLKFTESNAQLRKTENESKNHVAKCSKLIRLKNDPDVPEIDS